MPTHPTIDLLGQRFGLYRVIGPREIRNGRDVYWVCQCDCGNIRSVYSGNLRGGKSKSCGCVRNKATAERNYRHGSARKQHVTVEYRTWQGMRKRCEDPTSKSYRHYGGRGITVCEQWADFEAFLADMGPRPSSGHSIERIDNDGPYAPDNCRWATKIEQMNNTRRNRHLNHDGETHTMAEWSRMVGIPLCVIHMRLDRLGWTVERALTEPSTYPVSRLTYSGETHTLSEWSKLTGTPKRTIRKRLDSLGWSVERALTTPRGGRPR